MSDRDRARKLLSESGLDDGCLVVVYEGELKIGST